MEDVVDSRDVIERIETLTDLSSEPDFSEEEAEELKVLRALAEEASGYAADWQYGETLIRDSYFKDYAQELAEDCGMLKPELDGQWPYTCIDWDHAAKELQYDYTAVDFDGVTYWIRS
jgi:hypothetical protein